MKLIAVLLVVTGCSLAQQSVQFRAPHLPVGSRLSFEAALGGTARGAIAVGEPGKGPPAAMPIEQRAAEYVRYGVEILGVSDDGLWSRFRLRYGERADTIEVPFFGEKRTTHPVSKRCYVVMRKGNGVSVVREDGKAAGRTERKAVLRDMQHLMGRPPLVSLSRRPRKLKEAVTIPKDAARRLLGELCDTPDDLSLESMQLTLEKVAGTKAARIAVFRVEVRYANRVGGKDPVQRRVKARGTLSVMVDTCRLVAFDVEGTYEMTHGEASEGEVAVASAKGPFAASVKITVAPKRKR